MNVLIADDEAPARERLRQLVEDSGEHTVVGEAANGEQALQLASDVEVDVVLLDIRMPGMNGIETARHLNELENPPTVVFTTAYDEYAIEAFEARAVGYVMKPVRRRRLETALKQAARLNNGLLSEISADAGLPDKREQICARMHGKLKLIPLDDVDSFIADQKYVRVHHNGTDDLIDDSLKSLENEFADYFVRIHRNTLVAVSKIDTLSKNADGHYRITMRNATGELAEGLAVSRRHVSNVRRRLSET
jgi:two-component system response regulator AlgR